MPIIYIDSFITVQCDGTVLIVSFNAACECISDKSEKDVFHESSELRTICKPKIEQYKQTKVCFSRYDLFLCAKQSYFIAVIVLYL